jgi:hypothetical protein
MLSPWVPLDLRVLSPSLAALSSDEEIMKRPPGSRRPDRATSAQGTARVAQCEQRLHAALATLEQCRAVLIANASEETAQLVSMAILQLRMELNRITEAEWRAFCDALTPDRRPVPDSRGSTPRQSPRRRSSALHS